MYEHEKSGSPDPDYAFPESDGRDSNQIYSKIAQLEKAIYDMKRESERLKTSHEKLTIGTNSLKQYHTKLFDGNQHSETCHSNREALVRLSDYMQNRVGELEAELSSLSDDVKLTEILKGQYKEALLATRIRSEIGRMRIVTRMRHPCGDIHLFSGLRNTWEYRNASVSNQTTSKPECHSVYKQNPHKPIRGRSSGSPTRKSPKLRLYLFPSRLSYSI